MIHYCLLLNIIFQDVFKVLTKAVGEQVSPTKSPFYRYPLTTILIFLIRLDFHKIELSFINIYTWSNRLALYRTLDFFKVLIPEKAFTCHFFVYGAFLENKSSKCSSWWVMWPWFTKIVFWVKNNLSLSSVTFAVQTTSVNCA